jgi:hypothetical protein
MEGVINGTAAQIFGDHQIHCVLIFPGAERDEDEVIQNGLSDETLDIGGGQTGLERQGRESGEELGEAVGRHMTLDGSLMDSPQAGKGDRVMGMLLEQCGNEGGGVEADFHGSESAKLTAALLALSFHECADVPNGRRDFAGTHEDPVFLGDGRRGLHGTKTDAIGFERDFERVAGFEGKAITQPLRNHQPTHLIEREFHGNQAGIW